MKDGYEYWIQIRNNTDMSIQKILKKQDTDTIEAWSIYIFIYIKI